jgi:putative flippase GtrA
MAGRLQRIGGEVAKFSAVNVVATAVAILLFNLLVHGVMGWFTPGPLHGWPLTSWFLANCVGMGISFYGSRRYAFKHRRPAGPGGGALNFVVINLISFVIPMSCLWITRNTFGWDSALADNVSGNVVGALLGMTFRFWAFKRYVFKKHKPRIQRLDLSGARLPEVGPDEPQLVEHQS